MEMANVLSIIEQQLSESVWLPCVTFFYISVCAEDIRQVLGAKWALRSK
jgi:hypothetical protein